MTSARPRVYLSPPHLAAGSRELLLAAFDSNWIAPLGPHVDAFEREFAAMLGVRAAAALSSGTAALHLALALLGVKPRDTVLTSTLTFVATANAIRYLGATPVFIDVDPTTWQLDPRLVEEELEAAEKRNQLPKAVLAVDLYGQCADYDALNAACTRFGVPLIEDAAEALGADYRGRPAGTLASMGIFSFNGNKIITTSGGGMLVSDRVDWVDQARFLAAQARDPAPHYEHSQLGYNYRLSNLLAAVGRGQLQVLDDRVSQRRRNNALYHAALGDLPGIGFMPEAPYGRTNGWLSCITLAPQSAATPDAVRAALERENIESRPIWKPMHLQPVFKDCPVRGGKVAEGLFDRGLCLPSGSNLTDCDRQRVVDTVRSAVSNALK